jgi:hypothetical protein
MLVTCANHVQVYEKKSSRKLVCCLQHKIYPQKKLCASHLPARSRSSICAWRCALMCAWRCASNGCSPALFHVAFQACGHCERSRVLSPKKHDPKLMFSHVTWYFGWRCMYRHGNGNGNNTVWSYLIIPRDTHLPIPCPPPMPGLEPTISQLPQRKVKNQVQKFRIIYIYCYRTICYIIQQNNKKCNSRQYNTIRYDTMQYNTIQYNIYIIIYITLRKI